jgi:hypothetical protein
MSERMRALFNYEQAGKARSALKDGIFDLDTFTAPMPS